MVKELFSGLAVAITFIAFFPYIRAIIAGRTKPHVFSWIIWGTTTFIVFLAQLEDGGGVGAWPIGISGLITLFIAFLAYLKKSDITITRVDWSFFVAAMVSIPVWYVTSDPTWAVILLTTIDVIGFGPTIRKAFAHPYDEDVTFFALFVLRNVLVIAALENYSIATLLFPAVIAAVCLLFIIMIIHRRGAFRQG
ncbi:MAG: hypothetical protein B6D72_09965 [gamma proteobacterium symbiont of Ctena orbiculata]|uniref:Uncharacterized protein n=1 Tax=Candidatus Thiodiazotropha taylori TaxID=2792791 RepID=A0A944MAG0_9GAMM|nr:hypothetical protein [Candidatus Thiodiazotropha taylori]MBV2138138.1 hypothetical protein [Candidatus Thiodiazotropha taylori]PUB84952.1 MAG: hypothetical protein DBP00_13990 [gamma proteobacterium symbiont of Ctena orbiculata]PVV06968.1 MAG: hypothetical protein B6D82_17145 [gamma proteobacterium symbiont of Ctena orbiculata]PVV11500.1 MAG: hypothetical protein B6D72_09965 [gamma proteobacterium symbiont of Ctena orbiculata]